MYINFIIQLGLLDQYMCNINPIYVFKFNVVTMAYTHHHRSLLVFLKRLIRCVMLATLYFVSNICWRAPGHPTDEVKLYFISLASSVRTTGYQSISQWIFYWLSSLEPMDSTTTASPNLVVMAQQIQALTANVQELKKQNEDLKRRVHSKGINTS